ncbi:MAG TPA: FtsX-like permease family protein [Ktedonobacteraceae bacterium]|nr:FtsX-like permease family protein [Ktedonobacteraceae bacterium]
MQTKTPGTAPIHSPRQARNPVAPVITLALWRVRRTGFLLLITTLGLIATVIVACSIPLFSAVTATAGIRNILNAAPESATLNVSVTNRGLSTPIVHDVLQQFDPLIQQHIASYLQSVPDFSISSTGTGIISPPHTPEPYILTLMGASTQQMSSYTQLVQGRLPHANANAGNEIEIMLTPATAAIWQVSIGSLITLDVPFTDIPQQPQFFPGQGPDPAFQRHVHHTSIKARVVGLFTVSTTAQAYWHGQNLDLVSQSLSPGRDLTRITFLTANDALLSSFDQIAHTYHIPSAFELYTLNWYYHLDPTRISSPQLDDLITQLHDLQTSFTNKFGNTQGTGFGSTDDITPPYPYMTQVFLLSAVLSGPNGVSTLEQLRARIDATRIPVTIVGLQIIALVLFFVSLIADLLVDRQTDAIALLRSRGASGRQIFSALLTQAFSLSVIALLIGPPLALLVVYFFAQRALTPVEQGALNLITDHPIQAMLQTGLYAVAVALVAVITMGLSLRKAISMDVLSIRKEAARTTRRPLWQRLNLDVVAAIIALIGYAISLYLTSIGGLLDSGTQTLITAPLTLIAPFFLAIGSILLFLRLFPILLQLGARIAERSRSAPIMLALAQMARVPRQSVRMIMLLAFTTAFAIFSLIFTASQAQYATDLASYETGADFSGTTHASDNSSLADVMSDYRSIPGVLSVTAGFSTQGSIAGSTSTLLMEIRAVDADTYARTAVWPAQAANPPVSTLMQQLRARRTSAIHNDIVPVYVDTVAWNTLHLHIGSTFTIDTSAAASLNCLVIGQLEHIPTINDSTGAGLTGDTPPPGGILLDYQTYASIYSQDSERVGLRALLPINYFWLRTRDDPATLATIRSDINNIRFDLTPYYDRRTLIAAFSTDPFYLNLAGILTFGTITALLLALLGNLLVSLLTTRTRMTSFVVLRALGTTPRQVGNVLLWEQVIVYASALLLGLIFGTLFSVTMIPNLTLSSIPASGPLANFSPGQFYALQHVLPAQPVLPLSLSIILLALVMICVIALGMMIRTISRPSMSQVLRLNED